MDTQIIFSDSQNVLVSGNKKRPCLRDLNSNPFEFDSNGLNKFKVMKSPKVFGFLVEPRKMMKEIMGKVGDQELR